MPLLLTRQQLVQVMPDRNGHAVRPRLTVDGLAAVSESIASLPAYADVSAVLAGGTINTSPSYDTNQSGMVWLDGKPVYFANARKTWSVAEPASGVLRFEARENDDGTSVDLTNGNKRSEVVSLVDNGWTDGQTLWVSFSTILGPAPGLVLTDVPSRFGFVMQVHPPQSTWSPVLTVDYSKGLMRIRTRSDADFNTTYDRYSASIPARGVKTAFVMAITLGQSGHLKAWVNGSLVVDADMPIGFWTQGGVLGYPQWGLYSKNWPTRDVVYHANIEWGSASLQNRVATPLPVPDLSPWA